MEFTNLASRKDNMRNLEETFTYDDMNRLTAKTAGGQAVFSNPTFTAGKPHALASATTAEGVFPATAQTVTYTGFDKVSKVRQGNDSLCYTYGFDQQRIFMEEHFDNTVRTKRYVGNCEFVTENDGNTTVEYTHTYLTGPCGVFAVVRIKNGMTEDYYILKDNLGSWTTITGGTGIVKQELSYDAWGNYRDPDTWATYTADDTFDVPVFDRGFTGHEHLCNFGLINMNGRMYDPVMSSFLSADRYVQDPSSAQGFNRYAYCLYNPLRYVDPTGWLSGGGGNMFYPGVSTPKSPLSMILDYLSDPCYFTRQQLREAGIYDIEGGYGFYGGGGTMNANWMEGDGSVHYSSWNVQTEGGGFTAGAWAIPISFNPMWENYCQGFCDYGYRNFDNICHYAYISFGYNGNGNGVSKAIINYINNPVAHNANSFLGYTASVESTLFGAKSYGLQQPKNQKMLDELGKSLRSSYEARGIVKKGLSGREIGKIARVRMTTISDALGIAGLFLVGVDVVLNDYVIYPSNLLDAGIGIACLSVGPPGWIIGASYLVVDLGSYAFTGQSFGQHLNDWCGGVGYDLKTKSLSH